MRRVALWVMGVLALPVAAYAVASALVPDFRQPFVVDMVSRGGVRAVFHMGLGGLAITAGAFQFSERLRRRRLSLHRWLGRIYVGTVLVSGTTAVLIAPISEGGVAAHYGFGMLGVLWVGTAVVAYLRIRARDVDSHRAWMIRSYSLCLAAVTLRVYLPMSALAGIPFEEAYPAISWLCWVPNLILAEWLVVPRMSAAVRRTAVRV